VTPDGRYIVMLGRLWRRADPDLPAEQKARLVTELMNARRSVGMAMRSKDGSELIAARARGDAAKNDLGERSPVWWTDGVPDQTRRMARNTGYADWYAALDGTP
ncbi:MAG: hypothetical protein EON55_17210, partial [Alphaproteobacteria bacterium]